MQRNTTLNRSPVDLATVIMREWLSDLADLSSLDIVCGGRSLVMPFGIFNVENLLISIDPNHLPRQSYVWFLCWACSRKLHLNKLTVFIANEQISEMQKKFQVKPCFPMCTEVRLVHDWTIDGFDGDSARVAQILKYHFPSAQTINVKDWEDIEIQHLRNLTANAPIQALHFNNHPKLSVEELTSFFSLPNIKPLEELSINRTKISGEVLRTITQNCRQLRNITLYCDDLSREDLEHFFSNCSSLSSLKIKSSQPCGVITDELLERIMAWHPSLEVLDLLDTRSITLHSIQNALLMLPKLTKLCSLMLAYTVDQASSACTGQLVVTFVSSTKMLIDILRLPFQHPVALLDVRFYSRSMEEVVPVVVDVFSKTLTVLKLPPIASVLSPTIALSLLSSLDKLQCLEMSFASGISDEMISSHYFQHFGSKITSIAMVKNELVTDSGIKFILEKCPHLTSLNLAHCSRLTNAVLDLIRMYAPKVSVLNLRGTTCLAPEILQFVLNHRILWRSLCVNNRMEKAFVRELRKHGSMGKQLLPKIYFR